MNYILVDCLFENDDPPFDFSAFISTIDNVLFFSFSLLFSHLFLSSLLSLVTTIDNTYSHISRQSFSSPFLSNCQSKHYYRLFLRIINLHRSFTLGVVRSFLFFSHIVYYVYSILSFLSPRTQTIFQYSSVFSLILHFFSHLVRTIFDIHMALILTLILCTIAYPTILTNPFKSLPRSDIVHASSGLVFHYLSEYSPANRIVSFSVSIPMTIDMCYLIPINVIRKINQCHRSSTNSPQKSSRNKRFLTDIISIGIGSAALSLSTYNTIQNLHLQHEVKALTASIASVDDQLATQSAKLLHLSDGQLKLANELNYTQAALNRTIALVNDHSAVLDQQRAAIEALASYAQFFNNKLTAFIQSIETHFLHVSLSDILANRLNLHFIHHKDLPTVLDTIIIATNVSFNADATTLSLVDLVSRLLVQQRIDFAPSSSTTRSNVIGTLIISSFFAATVPNQPFFSLYELHPIPFNFGAMRVRLADIPFIVGIDLNSQNLIRWTKTEAQSCSFNIMSLCRETPPTILKWNDTCLYQILSDISLTACRTEPYLEPIFIHRIGNHWAISTNSSTQCHSVAISPILSTYVLHNAVRILPPVALVTVAPNTTLVCDHFSIPSLPILDKPSLTILDTTIINASSIDTVNLHVPLMNITRWQKLPYIPDHFQAMLDFLASTPLPPFSHSIRQWPGHPFSMVTISIVFLIFIILCIVIYRFTSQSHRQPRVHLELPTLT
jgi:hypothetical protein